MQPPSKREELALPRLLATLRKNAGMTQSTLGEKIGVHGDTLARYERGVRRVATDLLDLLITALKLDDEQAALLRAAREYDEPYWARGMRAALARVPPGPLSNRGEGMAPAASSVSEPNATLSADPTPAVPTSTTTPAAPDGPSPPDHVPPGAKALEEFINQTGDDPEQDDAVRDRVVGSHLLAIGAIDEAGLAHLLHCTVSVGKKNIAILPVFTRMDLLRAAVRKNPQWPPTGRPSR